MPAGSAAAVERSEAGEGAGKMKCPKCGAPLKEKMAPTIGTSIVCCEGCKSLWFDGGKFEQSVGEAFPGLVVPKEARKLGNLCPRCYVDLYTFVYPGTRVKIDMCKRCGGIWFDSGELGEVRRARRELTPEERMQLGTAPPAVKAFCLNFVNNALSSLRRF